MTQRRFSPIVFCALAVCAACGQTSHLRAAEVGGSTAAAIYPISLTHAEPPHRTASTALHPSPEVTEDYVCPLPAVDQPPAGSAIAGSYAEFSLLDEPGRNSSGGWGAAGTGWSLFGERAGSEMSGMWSTIAQDHQDFYSIGNLSLMAVGFGAAAAMANSDADASLQHWVQDDARSGTADSASQIAKVFGNGYYVGPAVAAAWLAGETFENVPLGETTGDWGERCMRSMLVGMPPLLVAQYATGGSRPGESRAASDWKPFDDDNGASGHAFIGALPFINAAKMTDNLALKVGLYACSALPAWSRVNDNAHYPSQSLLGWWLAYCAATAVDTGGNGAWQIVPLPSFDAAGIGLSYQF